MLKWISVLVLGVAVIAAALSGVYVMNARESIARRNAEAAESAEEAAKLAARKAESEAKAAAAAESADRAKLQAAQEQRKASEADREAKRADAKRAEHESEAARQNRAAREAEAAAAADARAAEKAKADAAQAEAAKERAIADAEIAKAQAEADKLEREKLAAQAIADEARLWELKALDLAALEQELNEYRQELDARELALRPEKTIRDLANISSQEAAQQDDDQPLLPENDVTLPRADRRLAKSVRIMDESIDGMLARSRAMTVSKLERLYVEAVRAGRITTADYYRKTLKSLYPDWEYKPPASADESSDGE